ncbi:hypothetical protein ECG_01951 [Echinococcus granulosus]|nr:hypothetical protein ECG_01951 [Echinococcus granulosus]
MPRMHDLTGTQMTMVAPSNGAGNREFHRLPPSFSLLAYLVSATRGEKTTSPLQSTASPLHFVYSLICTHQVLMGGAKGDLPLSLPFYPLKVFLRPMTHTRIGCPGESEIPRTDWTRYRLIERGDGSGGGGGAAVSA